VIAGTGCNHTARCFCWRQEREPVQRTPLLEAARHLQVFELQKTWCPEIFDSVSERAHGVVYTWPRRRSRAASTSLKSITSFVMQPD